MAITSIITSRIEADPTSNLVALFDRREAKGAAISADGLYRYSLWRVWNQTLPVVAFVMCNPSTADATVDDPTVKKCMGFARTWGFGGIVVVNLYAYRSTDPKELRKFDPKEEPHGPNGVANNKVLGEVILGVEDVVFAWGAVARDNGPHYGDQVSYVNLVAHSLGKDPKCIGTSSDGTPLHPLMQSYSRGPALYHLPDGHKCLDCSRRSRGRK